MNMRRRDFLEAAVLTFGLAALPSNGTVADPLPGETVGDLKVNPVLVSPGPDSITVVWMTEQPSTGWVEFGTGEKLGQKAYPVHDGLIDANQTLFSVKLENLKPGAEYRYRVVSKEVQTLEAYKVEYGPTVISKTQAFTTLSPDKKEFSFVVLNDLHNNFGMIGRNLNFIQEPYDFVVFNGDIIADVQNDAAAVGFLQAVSRFAGSTPIVFVRGNHEARGDFARKMKEYLLPHQDYYYGFAHGPAAFLVMDTGEDKPDSSAVFAGLDAFENYRTEQRQWLVDEMKKPYLKNASFRIFISHIPLYSNTRYNCLDGRTKWGPMLNSIGIDLYLAGHTHQADYVEAGRSGNPAPVAIGGGYKADASTVMQIDVNKNRIRVRTILNGEEIILREIERKRKNEANDRGFLDGAVFRHGTGGRDLSERGGRCER